MHLEPRSVVDKEPVDGLTVSGPASGRYLIGGRPYLNFSGAGYLALSELPELREAALDAIARGVPFAQQLPPPYGIRDPLFEEVEQVAADYMGTETAVFFASGYMIGMVALAAERQSRDQLFIDESAHQNLKDAAILSGVPITYFRHRDAEALLHKIDSSLAPRSRPLLLTDGTFAASGDLAPLRDYADILANFGGAMIVDDAHGFGVLGLGGRGAIEHLGVTDLAIQGATFSKALCAQGAVIGCTEAQARRINALAPKRGANAGSPISAAVSVAAMRYMRLNPSRRHKLSRLAVSLRKGLSNNGFAVSDSPSNIISFRLQSRDEMRRVQYRLFFKGIYLPISDYPGAGPGGIFRAAVYANHDQADIDRLVSELGAI